MQNGNETSSANQGKEPLQQVINKRWQNKSKEGSKSKGSHATMTAY
jgi:hypothetical protein